MGEKIGVKMINLLYKYLKKEHKERARVLQGEYITRTGKIAVNMAAFIESHHPLSQEDIPYARKFIEQYKQCFDGIDLTLPQKETIQRNSIRLENAIGGSN